MLAASVNGGERNVTGIVSAMIREAKLGNTKAAEWLADRAEGKAVQRIDVDVMRKSALLAEMYGLDPAEVASMARQIAEEEQATALPPPDDAETTIEGQAAEVPTAEGTAQPAASTAPENDHETVSEGGSPGQRDSKIVDSTQHSDTSEKV